ncbi:MAG: hypothetical protein AB7V44_32750, partial [Pseudonocardia sp.]
MTLAALPLAPLLPAATPLRWLETHLAAHQAAHDADGPGAATPRRWTGVGALLDDDAAALHDLHAGLVADGAAPAAAAKWLASWFAGGIADVVGFVFATASAALLVRPGRARFRLDDGGLPDRVDPGPARVAVAEGHPWAELSDVEVVADDGALAEAAVGALTVAAEPIVEACRCLARVGRPALWVEVGDRFGLPVLHQIHLPVDAAVADRMQYAVRTPSRPWRKVPDLRVADTPDGWTYLGRKGGCCLAYQSDETGETSEAGEAGEAGETDETALTERARAYRARFPRLPDAPAYCSTCSLRDWPGCEERQV